MAGAVTDFEQASGRLVLRCDTGTFERLQRAVCREAGAFVPVSVPVTPVREISVVLAVDVPPPRVAWWRHAVALLICLALFGLAPVGLAAVVGLWLGYWRWVG